jgi:PAS domain-containing protein
MGCSTWLTVWVLRACFGEPDLLRHAPAGAFISAITVMALVQYAANSSMVAMLVSGQKNQSFWLTWKRHYLWTSVTYFVGAALGAISARLIDLYGFSVALAITPVLAILYFTYRTYLMTVETSEAQAEQAQKHVEELSLYIRERERAEEALRLSEEKYRLLVGNVPDIVWTADETGRYVFLSRDMYGRQHKPRPNSTGDSGREEDCFSAERIHADDVRATREAYRSLFQENRVFDVEYRVRDNDGRWIWLHDKAVSTYEKGGMRYADGLCSDVTERRLLESQLRQAQKLESIGQLAAGIAHEINTPAQYVGDNTRFLRDAFGDLNGVLAMYGRLIEAGSAETLDATRERGENACRRSGRRVSD